MKKPPAGGDSGHWMAAIRIDKYDGDYQSAASIEAASIEPTDIFQGTGNMLMNAGIQRMLDKLIGAAGQVMDNTHARVGAGNSTTAAAATQTDLQASAGSTNRYFMTMDATFPSRASQTLTFKSTFASADGNFAWQEWGIDAGTAAGNTVTAPLLNRKVESMGTKSTGQTWVATVTITIS